tara:strand:+ start:216 stop:401 length:186 start_codon:yes stop_codon:yes gene_type:complete
MKEKFKDVSVGTVFTHEGQEYVKIDDIRVTCCKVHNCKLTSNSAVKGFVVPIHEVEVADND